jgi:hypothetical protein
MMQYQEILDRADFLKGAHNHMERRRIRAVMNGGIEGVQAILGWGHDGPEGDVRDLGIDLPTANIMWSGLERLAQRIGRMPTLKVEGTPVKDNDTARDRNEKRHRIIAAWDEMDRAELRYPQIGRWLPGYGFTVSVIREQSYGNTIYPVAELRDSFDAYPGWFGPNQQPREIAFFRKVDWKVLKSMYPELSPAKTQSARGVVILGQTGWEGGAAQGQVEVVEYICDEGTYMVCRETGDMLAFSPNPLSSGPAFVLTKRFAFDQLKGQYTHVFGLMTEMAKLNLLGMIAAEDSNFRETNVFGEMESVEYEKGRDAINFFQPGARVERPTGDILQQTFQSINVLERQLRTVAGYDVQQDGVSPNSFATGQGMKELQSSASNNVREYQTAIKHSAELEDRKRLEWDEVMHPNLKRKVYWYEGSKANEETYTPATDIAGDYRTKRVFGAMATFDETQKLLAGLQLLGARVIDRRTLQDNIDGLADDSITVINERILKDQLETELIASLGAKSQQGDPSAEQALVSAYTNPGDVEDILVEAYTPKEGAPGPDELAMAQAMGGGGAGGPAPPIQSVLTQMEAEGGGAQTVAVNR